MCRILTYHGGGVYIVSTAKTSISVRTLNTALIVTPSTPYENNPDDMRINVAYHMHDAALEHIRSIQVIRNTSHFITINRESSRFSLSSVQVGSLLIWLPLGVWSWGRYYWHRRNTSIVLPLSNSDLSVNALKRVNCSGLLQIRYLIKC